MEHLVQGLRNTGLLVYPPIKVHHDCIEFDYEECADQTRFFLSYFDRICAVGFGIRDQFPQMSFASEDLHLLVENKMVIPLPPRQGLFGEPGPHYLTKDMRTVFRAVNHPDGLPWAVAPLSGLRPDESTGVLNALTLRLIDLIPTPTREVPLVEVIRFRNDNIAKLRLVHQRMDEIMLGNPNNVDQAVRRLGDCLQDIEKVLDARDIPYFKASFSASQFLQSASIAGLIALICAKLGMEPDLIALLAGGLQLKGRSSDFPHQNTNVYPKDFEYVFLGRDLGIFDKRLSPPKYEYPIRYVTHINSTFPVGFLKEHKRFKVDLSESRSMYNTVMM